MKKNILTIIIMAISLINTVLIAMVIFSVVPTANKTNQLVSKVASIINLELENPDGSSKVKVTDTENYSLPEPVQCNLRSTDGTDHYLSVKLSITENIKHADYKELSEKVDPNANKIKNIAEDVFSKYTSDELKLEENKDKAKKQILEDIHNYFDSDFIIDIVLSDYLIQ